MFDWNKHIKEVIDRTEFMALSTIGNEGSWTCPVKFAYDERLNLYFKSMPNSRHMQYLRSNPDVSVAIFSTSRFPDENIAGLQIKGKAKILSTQKEVEVASRHHYGRTNSEIDPQTKVADHMGEHAEWNFVKIVPSEVWCFDTRHFGEERQRVSIEALLLVVSPIA